ncbi:MAG TPA: 3-phosphoglycerate dehydrogenase, partial [Sphingobacteriaceae bacterium]|nr:3-phosphoglycerate dehydrogenase [Sphingobacteriaceae bacterium]
MKILANDGIDPVGKNILEQAGFVVDTEHIKADDLFNRLNEYDAITVRSATQLPMELIDAAPNIKLIGRGGVGMDNIDVAYARAKGIKVVNTPAASSLSVAELVFSHLFSGVRFLHDAQRKMPAEGANSFAKLKKAY